MTRYFLKKISLEGFRGINNHGDPLVLKFKPNCVNSLHAPNGVGKTSIYEALHFAIHGYVPRLREMQDAEQGEKYLVNQFHPGSASTIELWFDGDDGTGEVHVAVTWNTAGVRTANSATGHPQPEAFLAALREDYVLVDYSRFGGFIDSSALVRGRSFSSLVGLSAYSAMRQALEGAKHTQTLNNDFGIAGLEAEISGEVRAQADRVRRATVAFKDVTGEEIASLDGVADAEAKATAALAQIPPIAPLMATSSVLTLDYAAAEEEISKAEGGDGPKRLARLGDAKTAIENLAVFEGELAGFEELLVKAEARDEAVNKVGSAALLSLLSDAEELIGTPDWPDADKCPVCELAQPTELKERLRAQIALYAAATALNEDLTQCLAAAACILKLSSLETAAVLGVGADTHICPKIIRRTPGDPVPADLLIAARERLKQLEELRSERLAATLKEIAELEATLPPSLVAVSKVVSSAKLFKEEVNLYKAAINPLKIKQERLAKYKRWKTFIAEASKKFSAAETQLSGERLTEIQASFQALFPKLVRGGPDVKPLLERAAASEQVGLTLDNFFGLTGVNARAVLSESYRNAVAASIFLSSAVKNTKAPRFIILDDVTSSFDGGHQYALMETIRLELQQPANADGIQFIILSHDTALEKYFDKMNGSTDWHHQKLQGLPPKGRVMVNNQENERLRAQAEQHLNAGQIDIGAPFVRQFMEYKLSQLINRLQIPVPPDYSTRGDKRTLSTYLEAINDAVNLYNRAGICVLSAQQIVDIQNTHVASIMANFVSHYETGAGNPFGAYPLLGVLQSIDSLEDCFTYADLGPPPSKKFYKRLDRRA